MKKLTWLLTNITLLSCLHVTAQFRLIEKVNRKANENIIPYEKYVLSNGLTVILHEDHSDPIVYVDVTYHVGSAREEIGKSGFAHFYEHMMFQGSDHVADGQHIKMMTAAGANLNGTTNRDRTNYWEVIPSNNLERALWLEADRMGFLLDAVTQKKFEIQRSTVKNERGERLDNVPYGLVTESYIKYLYPYGHPYSWMTIGYVEDLNRVDVNDLKNFFLRWYGPNNATVTVSGDLKPEQTLQLINRYFGSIPGGPEVTPVVVPQVSLTSNRYASYTDNYARLPLLTIVYPTVPDYGNDKASLECLAQILGQGKNSFLYQNIVKKQSGFQAVTYNTFSELAGELVTQIIPSSGKTLADMEKLFFASLDSFEARGVTDDDIAKFKGGMESQIFNNLQSVQGKGSLLASYQTFTGNPNKIADILKMYSSLTKEDVMAAYNKYIRRKGAVILSTTPKGQELMVASPNNFKIDSTHYTAPGYGYAGLRYVKATDKFNRGMIPPAGASPVVTVPAYWRKDLANGIKIIGTENNETPTVTCFITIPGGHLSESGDLSKAGLSNLFASMMLEDTRNFTAEQMTVALQKLGSSLSVSSANDGVTFTIQSLKKNLAKTMELVEERMLSPKFTEAAFNRIKNQIGQGIKLSKSQPSAVADAVFAKINYGPSHILGIPAEGTEESLKNLTLEDVQNYYEKYMTSTNTKVVVVGDLKESEFLQQSAFLNKLQKKKIEKPKIDPMPTVDKTKVYMVDVPKGAQTEFRIGFATSLTYNPTGDYYKANLSNFALGGGFNSRLNLNLRENRGWTYGASSTFTADHYSGQYQFGSGIKADVTDSALFETMRDINNYVANGPTDEELEFTKSAIGQSEARKYETGFQKAQFISRILDYNLPANYTAQQNEILRKLTREELKNYAQKYIKPEQMNIVLVGDKARIMDKVKALGYEIVEVDADGKRVDKKAF